MVSLDGDDLLDSATFTFDTDSDDKDFVLDDTANGLRHRFLYDVSRFISLETTLRLILRVNLYEALQTL
ncbi:hypothetical protein CHUAL_012900 [Chamberlinius hualienensis]